uniref:Uncharacterized protein n=1 Tax=Tetraselmis sp. GSL018 TaxID=582737 RepID=A0A061SF19_9CHLO
MVKMVSLTVDMTFEITQRLQIARAGKHNSQLAMLTVHNIPSNIWESMGEAESDSLSVGLDWEFSQHGITCPCSEHAPHVAWHSMMLGCLTICLSSKLCASPA